MTQSRANKINDWFQSIFDYSASSVEETLVGPSDQTVIYEESMLRLIIRKGIILP